MSILSRVCRISLNCAIIALSVNMSAAFCKEAPNATNKKTASHHTNNNTNNNTSNIPQEIQPINFVIKTALKQNPDILKSAELTKASKAAIMEAKAGFLPQINVSYGAGRENYRTDEQNKMFSNDSAMTTTTSSLTVAQPLFSGFSTFNLVRQRNEESNAAMFTEMSTKENLAISAAYAYLNVLRFEKLRALAQDNIAAQKEIVTKIKKKVAGGAGQQPDQDLAISRLAQRQATLATIEGSEETAKENFIRLVGFVPKKLILPTAPLLPKTLAEAKDIALATNPNLLTAQAALKAATHATSVAKSNFSPTINFEVSDQNSNFMQGYNGRVKDVRGMLVASYNIFNGGANFAGVDKASKNRMAALYAYNDTKNRVVENVSRAFMKLEADKLSWQSSKQHAKASAAVLKGYNMQFDVGRNSLLNVLDIENETFDANVETINTEYAIISDSYEVLAAMGKLASAF